MSMSILSFPKVNYTSNTKIQIDLTRRNLNRIKYPFNHANYCSCSV